jgi:hypothetical protein
VLVLDGFRYWSIDVNMVVGGSLSCPCTLTRYP